MTGSPDREGLLTGTRGEMEALPRGAVRGLAVTQIVAGGLAISAQIVILALYHQFFNAISQGIWCGAVFIVCGLIGVVAARKATKPWIISHLILCILTCLFCASIIGLSALTAIYNYGSLYNYVFQPCHYHPDYYDTAPIYGANPSFAPPGSMTAGPGYHPDYYDTAPIYGANPSSAPQGHPDYYHNDDAPDAPEAPAVDVANPSSAPSSAPGAPEREKPNEDWEYYFDPPQLKDSYQGYDTYPSYDTPMYTGSYWLSYYGNGYSCYNGRHVLNVPWVVQFSMSLLMGLLGILSAVIAVIAATLSCVPLCCDPLKNKQKGPQEGQFSYDQQVNQFEEAGALPIKSFPVDMGAGLQSVGAVTEA